MMPRSPSIFYQDRRLSVERRTCVPWAGFYLLFVSLVASPLLAQQDGDPTKDFEYTGIDKCAGCHATPSPLSETDFVPLTEFTQWATQDKHARSYLRIVPDKGLYEGVREQFMKLQRRIAGAPIEESWSASNELSAQICRKLEIDPGTFRDAQKKDAQQCLSCHANWRAEDEGPDPAVYNWGIGVGCESCHGPASAWAKEDHHEKPAWRKLDPRTKHSDFGMIDVRNPVKRAEQCFGCHIGSVDEGKVITHAMYAAGHPPLPSIEIESFAQQIPRHWRYLEEKIAATRKPGGNEADAKPFVHFDEFVRENHRYLTRDGEQVSNTVILGHKHRPAAVVLGGAIALREFIEQIRDLARDEVSQLKSLTRDEELSLHDVADTEESAKQAWPQLATLDCHACHHKLEIPSWRQEQRLGSIPGRPMIPQWPATLVPLAIRHAWVDDAVAEKKVAVFRGTLAAVHIELERTPYGDPSRLNATCSALLNCLEEDVIDPALAKPFDNAAIVASFTLLLDIGSTGTHDYDAARQIAWATRILSCGIAKKQIRDAIDAALQPLTQKLLLDLPNGPGHSCAPITKLEESRELLPIDNVLPATLSASYEFDLELFRKQMQKLRESLR